MSALLNYGGRFICKVYLLFKRKDVKCLVTSGIENAIERCHSDVVLSRLEADDDYTEV